MATFKEITKIKNEVSSATERAIIFYDLGIYHEVMGILRGFKKELAKQEIRILDIVFESDSDKINENFYTQLNIDVDALRIRAQEIIDKWYNGKNDKWNHEKES